jgi:hypothetical protein
MFVTLALPDHEEKDGPLVQDLQEGEPPGRQLSGREGVQVPCLLNQVTFNLGPPTCDQYYKLFTAVITPLAACFTKILTEFYAHIVVITAVKSFKTLAIVWLTDTGLL